MILFAGSTASAQTPQPPNDGCIPVSKTEYNSAKQLGLLNNRYGVYVRTGHFLKRYYWYCQ